MFGKFNGTLPSASKIGDNFYNRPQISQIYENAVNLFLALRPWTYSRYIL